MSTSQHRDPNRGGRRAQHLTSLLVMTLLALALTPLSAAPPSEPSRPLSLEALPKIGEQVERLTRTYLDPALQSRANRFTLKLTEGRIKYLSEDYRTATQILLEILDTYQAKGDPLYREALFYLADSLYHIGNLKSSAERFRELLTLGRSKTRVCALGRLVELSVTLGRPELAARYQEEALREVMLSPDPHILYQLGKYSFEQGRLDEAQRLWIEVSDSSSVYPQAQYFIAVASLKRGDLDDALKRFQALTKLQTSELKAAQALRLDEQRSLGERRDQLADLIRSQDPSAVRCVFRSQQEQRSDVKGWDQVIAEASLAVARIYYEKQQYDEATSAYLEVPRGSMSFREAIEESVWVAIRQGLYKQALQRLDIQLIDEPDMLNNPNTRLLQGRLMSTLGRFEDARSLFQEIRHRFELLKGRDIAPIMREARGQLPQHFQRLIERGDQALNLEALIPKAARSFITRELSSSAARSMFVELFALKRDLSIAEEDIKLLKWVLDAPNRAELFPQIHEGLLRSLGLRSQLFTLQRLLNERRAAQLSSPEHRALKEQVERAYDGLKGVPVSALDFKELEHQVERQLLSSDLTLSKIKLTLANFDSQLSALRVYLKDLRGDEVGKVLTGREREALIEQVSKEEQRTARLKELAQQTRDQLRKTQLRIGLYDEAFQLDEALRSALFEALNKESEWLVTHRHLDSNTLAKITRLHKVILDFQKRSIALVDESCADLKAQLLVEEQRVSHQRQRLERLTKRAQRLAGQIAALAFYKVLDVINAYLLESDAGLLDVTWSQKAQRSELLTEERKRRRIHLKVLQRDLVDAPL